jgi:hypothetical protein
MNIDGIPAAIRQGEYMLVCEVDHEIGERHETAFVCAVQQQYCSCRTTPAEGQITA